MKRAWLAILMAGCSTSTPAAPRTSETAPVLAVLPVGELGPLLVSELSKTGRWRASLADEGRKPKADAILAVRVVEFDPYDPPRLSLSVRMQRGSGSGAGDLDRLTQSGAWTRPARGNEGPGFDLVLDSRDQTTREALRSFLRTQEGPFVGEAEVLAVSSSYLRFAAHEVAARVAHER
jgi:hypothetical protein